MLSPVAQQELTRVLSIIENTLTFSISYAAANTVVNSFSANAFLLIFSVASVLYIGMRMNAALGAYKKALDYKIKRSHASNVTSVVSELVAIAMFVCTRATTLAAQFVSNFVANVLKATVTTTESPGLTALVAVLGLVLIYVANKTLQM